MRFAEFSMGAFAVLNGARVLAYTPQIICVGRDRQGAGAVSLMTWGMFTLANLATVSYALTVSHDHSVACVFTLNVIGCLAIFLPCRSGSRARSVPDSGSAGSRRGGPRMSLRLSRLRRSAPPWVDV